MRNQALLGLSIALLCILLYITMRFEFTYALSATVCLAHDVLISLGAVALLHYLGVPIQIDLNTVAAVMTIVGYSLNDTIIVYDRIRDNLRKVKRGEETACINRSINETLSRTLLTSFTTLIVVVTLFIYGGGVIHTFAFALMVGILIGTYSSIFVASPILVYYNSIFAKPKGA